MSQNPNRAISSPLLTCHLTIPQGCLPPLCFAGWCRGYFYDCNYFWGLYEGLRSVYIACTTTFPNKQNITEHYWISVWATIIICSNYHNLLTWSSTGPKEALWETCWLRGSTIISYVLFVYCMLCSKLGLYVIFETQSWGDVGK